MKKLVILTVVFLSLLLGFNSANAYVTNNYKKYPPKQITIFYKDGVNGNLSLVRSAASAWNYSGSPVYLSTTTDSASAKIKVSYSNIDSGSFATAYNGYSIVFYSDFNALNSTQKKETAVHEFGHTIGLGHTQSYNDTISVMRAYGFNNKPYPLSDDKAGLNYIYK